MSHLYAIVPILQHIVNLCLTTGDFPISCKSSIVIPLIKKPGLDREMLKNYRPVLLSPLRSFSLLHVIMFSLPTCLIFAVFNLF